ncbi:HNH endonuclease [Candidatus Dojkabacteria bacterium]|uniref:HNH endonuclease n=1 Tax=Candidatus Dojkabacteria bacterium TaxID=2099670 RepID=A0A847D1E6_9BACT|nr:HNH endonuclease [Candidatus Dojkabacteria bacterium]
MASVTKDPEKLRIHRFFNWTCQECGKKEDPSYPIFTIHHINPKSNGGTSNLSNLLLLCQSCHRRLHHSEQKRNKKRKK